MWTIFGEKKKFWSSVCLRHLRKRPPPLAQTRKDRKFLAQSRKHRKFLNLRQRYFSSPPNLRPRSFCSRKRRSASNPRSAHLVPVVPVPTSSSSSTGRAASSSSVTRLLRRHPYQRLPPTLLRSCVLASLRSSAASLHESSPTLISCLHGRYSATAPQPRLLCADALLRPCVPAPQASSGSPPPRFLRWMLCRRRDLHTQTRDLGN